MHALVLLTLSLSATTDIQDGSLLVFEHSNKPVAQVTGSSITHVAILFHHGDTQWVYEATPAKTRRLKLTDYQNELGELDRHRGRPTRVSVLEPSYPYSELQIEQMRAHAASRIGRRYSVKGYVRGKESDGIHCAQLAAATLAASGRFRFDKAYAISPGELVANVRPLHKSPVPLAIATVQTDESWCERSWTAWFNYGAWCRWACYETWTFCW